jgi:hypothetical protein
MRFILARPAAVMFFNHSRVRPVGQQDRDAVVGREHVERRPVLLAGFSADVLEDAHAGCQPAQSR